MPGIDLCPRLRAVLSQMGWEQWARIVAVALFPIIGLILAVAR